MAVRTKQLASGVMSTSQGGFYTCPAGHTAIIKQIVYYNPVGGAVTTVSISVITPAGLRVIVRDVGAAIGVPVRINGLFIVMNELDDLVASVSVASAVTLLVGGAELEGVA